MEKEKLNWVESHTTEIIYLNKNRNNPELCKMYPNEIKQIDSMLVELNKEFKQRIKDFSQYLDNSEEFREHSHIINKSYNHQDKNNICYMKVFEIRKHQLKIDVVAHMSGFSINFRTLEKCTDPMDVKARFMSKLKNNNIEIIDNPKNPYTDIYHITASEWNSEVEITEVAMRFIEILKIFK